MSTIPASAAGCAAKSRTRRCSVLRSTARSSCSIPPAGTECSPRFAPRSSASCSAWRTGGGRVMSTERRRCRSPLRRSAGRAAAFLPIGSSRSRNATAGWCSCTSVPGVAQRTGTTVYYLETCPRPAQEAGADPCVDAPAGRRGCGGCRRTDGSGARGGARTRDAGSHHAGGLESSGIRHYARNRRSAMALPTRMRCSSALRSEARRLVCFDMEAIASDTGSVISSVLLGALAASGALPFPRDLYEQAIRKGGVAVAANLAGFAAGFDAGAEAFTGPRRARAGDRTQKRGGAAARCEGPYARFRPTCTGSSSRACAG